MGKRFSGSGVQDNRRRTSGNAGAPAVTYRLFTGVSGPAAVTSYSGIFGPGVTFHVTSAVSVKGYSYWCPNNGDTLAKKWCLYHVTGTAAGTVVSGTTIMSGVFTQGQWNDTLLGTPVALTVGLVYCATLAYSTTVGFPFTNNQFGPAEPYANGITNGPLTAYSDKTGSNPSPGNVMFQEAFQVANADPTLQIPNQGSNSGNAWVDVIVG